MTFHWLRMYQVHRPSRTQTAHSPCVHVSCDGALGGQRRRNIQPTPDLQRGSAGEVENTGHCRGSELVGARYSIKVRLQYTSASVRYHSAEYRMRSRSEIDGDHDKGVPIPRSWDCHSVARIAEHVYRVKTGAASRTTSVYVKWNESSARWSCR